MLVKWLELQQPFWAMRKYTKVGSAARWKKFGPWLCSYHTGPELPASTGLFSFEREMVSHSYFSPQSVFFLFFFFNIQKCHKITSFAWYMLGSLSDNLDPSSYWPHWRSLFLTVSWNARIGSNYELYWSRLHGDIHGFFYEHFWLFPGMQLKNELYWSYELEYWAWRIDLPSAHLQL